MIARRHGSWSSHPVAQPNQLDGPVKPAFAIRPLRAAVLVGIALLCAGCAFNPAPVLFPDGPITLTERDLMFAAAGLILIVIIPVYLMAVVFSWRYRASGGKGTYAPNWTYSVWMDSVVWLVPALIVIILGTMVWGYTHRLDPYKKLASTVPPLEVHVVAQDWKWLFIYPAQNIAVVNELVFPSGTPLNLKITSDTVMNSFYLPALGGQIFAMAGMQTQLNLLADKPARFMGRNSQYSGNGFSKQFFAARATTKEEFDAWVAKVKQAPNTLDPATYTALAKKSIAHPVTYYSAFEPNLFDKIIAKYAATAMPAGHAHAK
jgi:cytochrome o ubiquinol oxidase subunit II